jgi:tetratricopeptide (TPR) repeat protein
MRGLLLLLLTSICGWAQSHLDRGDELSRAGRYREAIVEFQAALDSEPRLALNNMGTAYSALGQLQEAESAYRRALALGETPTTLSNLGALYLRMGRLSQADQYYRKADNPAGLALIAQERHQYAKAEELYRRALSIRESAELLHNLATLLHDTGRDDEALPLFDKVEARYREQNPEHPLLAVVWRYQAEIRHVRHDDEGADRLFRQSLALCEKALPPDHPQTGTILGAYATFLKQTGRKKESVAIAAQARTILAKSPQAQTVDASRFAQ